MRSRLEHWTLRAFPGDRACRALILLLILLVVVIRLDKFTLPFSVGWPAARALVDKEAELKEIKRETFEYQAATDFFKTPRGKEYARRMVYHQALQSERQAHLTPPQSDPRTPATRRVRDWLAEREARAAAGAQYDLDVLQRWAMDPPGETKPLTRPARESLAKALLRRLLHQRAEQKQPNDHKP